MSRAEFAKPALAFRRRRRCGDDAVTLINGRF
jgi:hypothetical protein